MMKPLSYAQLKALLLNSADRVTNGLATTVPEGRRLNAYNAVRMAMGGVPPASPPPPLTSPPPPAPLSLPSTPVAVGALPFVTDLKDLSAATTTVIDSRIAGSCPAAGGTALVPLLTTGYRKNIWKLTGLPTNGTLSVDNCVQPNGIIDTISAVLSCATDLSSCTCYTNDDGCGYSNGDSVGGIPLLANREYYSIVMAYAS